MPDESALNRYKKKVLERIEEITKALAYIAFGDYSHRTDPQTIQDDEFAEIFCGLDLLVDELIEARKLVDEQKRFILLRADIWKSATAGYDSENDLIQKLLDIVGPALAVARASYFRIHWTRNMASLDVQWRREALEKTVGLELPLAIFGSYIGKRLAKPRIDSGESGASAELRNVMARFGSASMLVMVNGPTEKPFGFFTFSDADPGRAWNENEETILSEMVNIVSTKIAQIKAEEVLRLANLRLEDDVHARTAELDAMNKELQKDIARRKKTEKDLRE
ncbi:MAG: hypothetical protein PHC61_18815, partial [Chitinivibrionales bacterium]|nr:hypothetical protein [Chitinivibrionales bacterium]